MLEIDLNRTPTRNSFVAMLTPPLATEGGVARKKTLHYISYYYLQEPIGVNADS